jgi:hypothetical protein
MKGKFDFIDGLVDSNSFKAAFYRFLFFTLLCANWIVRVIPPKSLPAEITLWQRVGLAVNFLTVFATSILLLLVIKNKYTKYKNKQVAL